MSLARVELLESEVARLRVRVVALERVAFASPSEYVEGWTGAAKIVGVNERTCRRRTEAGTFPMPCRVDVITRTGGPDQKRPVWRRCDLEAYAEGRR